jgi:hypothetical protein
LHHRRSRWVVAGLLIATCTACAGVDSSSLTVAASSNRTGSASELGTAEQGYGTPATEQGGTETPQPPDTGGGGVTIPNATSATTIAESVQITGSVEGFTTDVNTRCAIVEAAIPGGGSAIVTGLTVNPSGAFTIQDEDCGGFASCWNFRFTPDANQCSTTLTWEVSSGIDSGSLVIIAAGSVWTVPLLVIDNNEGESPPDTGTGTSTDGIITVDPTATTN